MNRAESSCSIKAAIFFPCLTATFVLAIKRPDKQSAFPDVRTAGQFFEKGETLNSDVTY